MTQRTSIRNGEALADLVLDHGPVESVHHLLSDTFAVPEPTAEIIVHSFQQADVSICTLGGFAMADAVPKKVARRLTSLHDAFTLPTGQISIHPGMVDAVQDYLLHDSVLNLTPENSEQAAFVLSAAYEMGRYLGYGIWHLATERRLADKPEDDSYSSEAKDFFDAVVRILEQRGMADGRMGIDYDPQLAAHYNNQVLPERFFSRAGIMVIEELSNVITGDKLLYRVREAVLNRYMGELTTGYDTCSSVYDAPVDVDIPTLEDFGGFLPLSDADFQAYWPTRQIAPVINLQQRRIQR